MAAAADVVFVALTAAQAVIYLLARNGGLTVNGQSAFILTVLVFGAGTDYALLLTARYREELRRHADRHEAMGVALGRAAPAIIASGATVILSLLCLLVAELASTKSLGPVMAIGVAVGLLAMITLLPALLVIFGRWVFWPLRPAWLGRADRARPVGPDRPAHRPPAPAGLGRDRGRAGRLALGVTGLDANGLQSKDSFRTKPEAVTGEAVLARHFPAGEGNPVQVIGNAERRAAAAGRPGRHPGGDRGHPSAGQGRLCVRGGDADQQRRQPGGLRPGPAPLTVSTRSPAPRPRSAAAAPSTSTSCGPPATTGTWWCRWSWSW